PNPTTQGDTANPNAAAATGLYKTFTGELFVGGANLLDVSQGSAGTCYLLAALAGVANSAPSALQSTFVSAGSVAGNRVWGVRFYDTKGKEVWVTANDQFVVSDPQDSAATYAKATGRDAQGAVVPELWVPLLEKAYAQANELGAFRRQNDANAMFAIEGGMAEAVSNVVGGRMTWIGDQAYSSINGNPLLSAITAPAGSTILAEVAKAINAGQVVWVGSDNKTVDASGATLWTGGHAFLALDPDPNNPNDTQIRVYNPWGFSASNAQNPPSFVSPFLVDLASVAGVKGYDFYVQVWGSAQDDVIFGVEAGERLDGAEGNDVLRGLGGNDTLLGGPGNDVISGGPGNDSIDGGDGDDVVTYPGDRSLYTITVDETGKITTISSASEGTDTILNVERFQFGTAATAVASSALGDKTPPSVTAANPLAGAKQVALDATLKFTFSEPIQLGKGVITLKDADGKVVETFTAANATISGNTLSLKPTGKFQVFSGYTVDFGSSAVQDLAGNAFQASQPYSLKSTTVDGLYHFFVVAFAAAPGATYMGQLAEAVNYGLSLPQIVEIFTTKKQFTDVYPTTMSNRELATVLINNIVKTSATEAARNEAINDIEAVLSPSIGWSRGKMLYTVFGNLANKPLTDTTWGGTAKQFQNQLSVARYFTEEMSVASENLATLRGVIGSVTPDTDVSTIDKIVQIIGTVPPPGG
ncbi:MAG: Ig-like domain-containing protein, partial [Rubrivivax sp.]